MKKLIAWLKSLFAPKTVVIQKGNVAVRGNVVAGSSIVNINHKPVITPKYGVLNHMIDGKPAESKKSSYYQPEQLRRSTTVTTESHDDGMDVLQTMVLLNTVQAMNSNNNVWAEQQPEVTYMEGPFENRTVISSYEIEANPVSRSEPETYTYESSPAASSACDSSYSSYSSDSSYYSCSSSSDYSSSSDSSSSSWSD